MIKPLAILKLSFNKIGDSQLIGGICGSAFIINNNKVLTASHVLNSHNYCPNDGFKCCQYWLLSMDGESYLLQKDCLIDYPEIDTTVIKLDKNKFIRSSEVVSFAKEYPDSGDVVLSLGFVGGKMPKISNPKWTKSELVFGSVDLTDYFIIKEGKILSLNNFNINALDIKLEMVKGMEISSSSMSGMSGGPLCLKSNNNIVGLLSFGLPINNPIKNRTFVISNKEIQKRIKGI